MPTSARKRRNLDMGRLREAMRGPGADTRVWLATARVDVDPDATVWDEKLGWLVDVTFYGGPLDQEGPIPCRLGQMFAQDGATRADPPGQGCEVLVAITDGDANSNPVIVARQHNAGGCEAPITVNGIPIDELLAAANHLVITPHGALEQYGGDRQVTAPNQALEASALLRLEGAQISIGGSQTVPPTSPAVLGTQLQAATTTLNAGLNTYAAAILVAPIAGAVNVASASAAATALATALTAYATAITAALSARTKLD